MTFTKLTLTLSALVAATPAFAHPGHGAGGHVHWEFVAAGLVFAGALGLALFRRRKTAQQRK